VKRFLFLLVLIATTLVLGSCLRVMVQRVMDYDEIAHAHAVWLTALGDVPFYDFFENHPPFPWIALAPMARGVLDGETLVLRLRILSFIGQIAFLVLLVANMRLGRRDLDPLWTCVALLTMLTSEGNIGYLIESRPDIWAAAALLGAILIARLESIRPFVRYSAYGFLATASLCWSPKLIALAGLFGLVEVMVLVRNRRESIVAFLAMIAGGTVAIALALATLSVTGIDPRDAYALTIGYNSAFGRNGGWGPGLWRTILTHWTLSVPAAGGLVCWLIAVARRELRPSSFEIAVAGFLFAQLVLVPFPYKQYYAPWLFFAAVFIPFYSLLVDRVRVFRAITLPIALVFLCVKAAFAYQIAGTTDGFERTGEFWRFLKAQAGDNLRIVAPIPLHPITVRDTMYAVTGTNGVDIRYGPEAILRDLAHPVFSPRFTEAYYRNELETKPPQVIVIGTWPDSLFPIQRRVVESFLHAHAADYERRVVGWREVFVRR